MERTTYADGLTVGARQLNYTEFSKADALLSRWTAATDYGVVAGLTVTATGNSLNVAGGTAFVPNGERVTVPAALSGINLRDPATGVANYVCLVYTEVASAPAAHSLDGTTRTTRQTESYRLRVMSLAELQALTPTSTDLTVDAQDRTALIAAVPGPGLTAGVVNAIPGGSIVLPFAPFRVLSVEQPLNVTGVVIVPPVEPTTPASNEVTVNPNALLSYDVTAQTLTYRAPGDTTATLIPMAIGAGGNFTLPSGSTPGHTLTVTVYPSLLPPVTMTPTTLTDSLVVTAPYGGLYTPKRGGAADIRHRALIGTGMPTVHNPHGLSADDLVSTILTLAESGVFGTGLGDTTAHGNTPRIITLPSLASTARTCIADFEVLSGGSVLQHVRLYATQAGGFEFTVNARWDNTRSKWYPDAASTVAWKAGLASITAQTTGSNSGLSVQTIASAPGGGWADGVPPGGAGWDAQPFQALATGSSYGQAWIDGLLTLGDALRQSTAAGDHVQARLVAGYSAAGANGDFRTLLFESQRGNGLNFGTVRVYRAATSLLGIDSLELTFNAKWVPGTSLGFWQWDALGAAMMVSLNDANFNILVRSSTGTATWNDAFGSGNWDAAPAFHMADGNVIHMGVPITTGSIDVTGDVTVSGSVMANGDVTTLADMVAGGNFTTAVGFLQGSAVDISGAAPTSPLANRLYGDMIAIARGTVLTNGSSVITAGAVGKGYTAAMVGTNVLRISLTNPLSDFQVAPSNGGNVPNYQTVAAVNYVVGASPRFDLIIPTLATFTAQNIVDATLSFIVFGG